MEAVAWLAGEQHSDQPTCACPVIGAFMRTWGDSIRDDETRTRLLRPLVPLLVGSRSTSGVELKRSYLALDWLARECAPAWLSLRADLKEHADALRGLKPLVDSTSCRAARVTARTAARDAAAVAVGTAILAADWDAAAIAAAWDAAKAAAGAAAWNAAKTAAGNAGWNSAWAAAGAAAWDLAKDAAAAAAWTAAGDAARSTAATDAADVCSAVRDAAAAALAPTVATLQQSASDLMRRMVATTVQTVS